METDRSGVKKKIGILGGTLDPIHFGHLRVAEEVFEVLELDEVWFVPAFLPPHKIDRPLTPFEQRYEMVTVAIETISHFKAKELEKERQTVSYSVDLLKQIRARYGEALSIFFIIGTDAAIEIDSWKDWRRLPGLANLVLVNRPPVTLEQVRKKLAKLFPDRPVEVSPVEADDLGVITAIKTTGLEISSTSIREKVRQGKSIRFLLPETVRKYIMEKGLYKVKKDLTQVIEKEHLDSMSAANEIYRQIHDNKGENIVVLDMRGVSPVADFFIIAHGRSTRHVQGMANRMKRELSRIKIKCRSVEGEEEGKWVLMDFDDVVVHLFYEPVRAFYDLEGLWYEAPRLVMTQHGLRPEVEDEQQ